MVALGESLEDYLEAIFVLSKQLASVHNIDIACYLGFSKSSVSNALKTLKEKGLIVVDSSRSISLTQEGEEHAKHIYDRHRFFVRMLMDLGVEETIARKDACRMEHVVSKETFACIKAYMKRIQ